MRFQPRAQARPAPAAPTMYEVLARFEAHDREYQRGTMHTFEEWPEGSRWAEIAAREKSGHIKLYAAIAAGVADESPATTEPLTPPEAE